MDEDLRSTYKVKINCGGKHFEVSRSLINQYPESMIGRLVSDTWQKSGHNEAIFIDRDGDIFGHILNYMRYKSIELPTSLPKLMFQRELDFYGLDHIGHIKEESPVETLKEMKQNLLQQELHHDMLLIASTCYHQFMMGEKMVVITNSSVLGEQLKHSPFHYNYGDSTAVLNYYLRRFFGLKATPQASLTSVDFLLEVRHISEGDCNDSKHYFAKEQDRKHSNATITPRTCDDVASISASDLMTP